MGVMTKRIFTRRAGTVRSILGFLACLAIVAGTVVMLSTAAADARAGGGSSFGSRGSRSFSTPAPTPTAPGAAAPFQRSMQQNPGAPMGMSSPFGGLGRGLLFGLVGGGLIGMLMGNGMGSIFSLILQVGLIFILVRFAMALFGRRAAVAGNQPGFARSGLGSMGAPAGPAASTRPPSAAPPLPITAADYARFEQLLTDIQSAFGREDVAGLRRMSTPEMMSHFEEELAANAAKGLVNKVSGAKLLRGDLSEAWRETQADYATVAMRYQILDMMVERSTGRIVSGDPARPDQVTEIWTFLRPRGGDWQLSAIQQV
ncbi:Predicted lipid-binding transport protein, Tim44 family [Rhizobiales bacterium GAS191]|nr:Predicted lipid-binding transport protein, Tim44 family [Rhizobiales bacterium GAS113]SED44453.1 Predicted lipid-binding transport protein, Tim44 family [Rhizobiales bacterium GAS188]SEE93368.1 Predicted lipid-binding transport protein, Tim44 family [Rhizobiales bacterium GAS191]